MFVFSIQLVSVFFCFHSVWATFRIQLTFFFSPSESIRLFDMYVCVAWFVQGEFATPTNNRRQIFLIWNCAVFILTKVILYWIYPFSWHIERKKKKKTNKIKKIKTALISLRFIFWLVFCNCRAATISSVKLFWHWNPDKWLAIQCKGSTIIYKPNLGCEWWWFWHLNRPSNLFGQHAVCVCVYVFKSHTDTQTSNKRVNDKYVVVSWRLTTDNNNTINNGWHKQSTAQL